MKCSLKSDRHEFSSYSCVHIEVLHSIHRAEPVSWSHQQCTYPAFVQSRLDFSNSIQGVSRIEAAHQTSDSSSLSYRGTRHVLLCQTDLAARIWPCEPSQPVALLRSRQMIVDFIWDGTVVWFCVPSRFSWLDTSRTRAAVPAKSL